MRSTLVARTPLPHLKEVYNIVCQEEDLKVTTRANGAPQEISAYAVQSRSRTYDEKDKGLLCKHCQRSDHASDSCFAVVGYPEWWGDRPKSRTIQGRGRGGNSGPVPVGRGRIINYANTVHVPQLSQQAHANYVITDRDRDGVHGLNDNQWQTLMTLLNGGASTSTKKLSGTKSISSWMMDSGASHHLTGNYDLLTDVRKMESVLVIMADGRERISVTEGTVVLGSPLTLKSVFFVEELQSDLIAIRQLMDENNCVVQLPDQFLIVQDRVSRMAIVIS